MIINDLFIPSDEGKEIVGPIKTSNMSYKKASTILESLSCLGECTEEELRAICKAIEALVIVDSISDDAINRQDVIKLFEDKEIQNQVPGFCKTMIEILNLFPSIIDSVKKQMEEYNF